MSPSYRNPVLSGFHPDPSVCRAGEDFYLVNSSFGYFPGIPVHHSRDLVHWEQIGNALDRSTQLPLEGAGSSRGIFAPTIRHAGGLFYIVCTNVDSGGNFIVTAADPSGPWSEPVWLSGSSGIDPSLYFEEDGARGGLRAWCCGTREDSAGPRYFGDNEIWLQELELGTLRLMGEPKPIWKGALRDSVWPEGPHIYRRGSWYYLMIAEGGTDRNHAVCVARSRRIEGPYEGKSSNPILTHRHLGAAWPIVNAGHGELVEDQSGDWWMLLLASRPNRGFTSLGRETFLVPVAWEDEWPLPCPGTGLVAESFPCPALPAFEPEPESACEQFDEPSLAPLWLSLRGPAADFSSLSERPGWLRLRLLRATLRDKERVSFLCRRQLDQDYAIRSLLEFSPQAEGEAAGIALFQSEDFNYRLELAYSGGKRLVRLVRAAGSGPDELLAERPYAAGRILLAATCRGGKLSFRAGASASMLESLAGGIDASVLSTERAGGFVGTVLGMHASGGGSASPGSADFDYFEYRAV